MNHHLETRMVRLATSVVFSLAFTLAGPAIACDSGQPDRDQKEPEVREELRPIDHRLAAGALSLDLWLSVEKEHE